MEMIEILPIAMLATAFAIITWYILYAYTEIQFFESFYTILIFPIIFSILLIGIRKLIKSNRESFR